MQQTRLARKQEENPPLNLWQCYQVQMLLYLFTESIDFSAYKMISSMKDASTFLATFLK